MSARKARVSFIAGLLLIFAVGVALRTAWLRADPPAIEPVGIVWHDEGAWTHNARNRVLFGVWRTDAWNPVFVAPVFTALEYGAFRVVGVGTWQARLVPVLSGLCAVAALIVGLRALTGTSTALVGGALLATNYVFVMWNRAAMMESTMTAFIALAWMAYTLMQRRPAWGLAAGTAATLAWFTKASAAFLVAALVLDVVWILTRHWHSREPADEVAREARATELRGAWMTTAGLTVSAAAILALFVLPYWTDYRFYNWQMSVTRKPEYSIGALVDRASWLPLVHDLFTRMWLVVAAGCLALLGIVARWRHAQAGERLLVLWVLVGLAELVAHDAGNGRRYVMFIPPFVALGAMALTSSRPIFPAALATAPFTVRLMAIPLLLLAGYLVLGSLLRVAFAVEADGGHLRTVVRLSAALAAVVTLAAVGFWSSAVRWFGRQPVPRTLAIAVVVISVVWDFTEFGSWARYRTEKNYEASVTLGRLLPPGSAVQGKLANGLALENQIRPLFVGNGFGNYADRLQRSDVRYILTYDLPRIGYESADGSGLIQGMLDVSPGWRVVASLDVEESQEHDRAVLIDKFPAGPARPTK